MDGWEDSFSVRRNSSPLFMFRFPHADVPAVYSIYSRGRGNRIRKKAFRNVSIIVVLSAGYAVLLEMVGEAGKNGLIVF